MKSLFDGLWSLIHKESDETRERSEILGKVPVFDRLTRHELSLVSHILHQREYKAGELVFREGEAGNGMYIIRSGHVQITGVDDNGECVVYAELGDNQFFGELALTDKAPRSATVTVIEPAVLYGFFKPDLVELMDKNPVLGSKILWNLARVVGDRLRATNERMMEFQLKLSEKKSEEETIQNQGAVMDDSISDAEDS